MYKEETRRAIDFALHNPVKELKLIPQKLWEFYRADGKVTLWIQKGTLDAPAFSSAAENRWEGAGERLLLGGPRRRRDRRSALAIDARSAASCSSLMVVLYYSFLFGFVFIGEQRFHSALIPRASPSSPRACLVGLAERIRLERSGATAAEAAPSRKRRTAPGGERRMTIDEARRGLAGGDLPPGARPAGDVGCTSSTRRRRTGASMTPPSTIAWRFRSRTATASSGRTAFRGRREVPSSWRLPLTGASAIRRRWRASTW